ncbi:MAG: OadG family protein [Lachnospiraceae bacterium]|nr:OadG family protein [Lachnospiraceae bacterium]
MKKFHILIFMMIAAVFSLTGCGQESALKYDYDQQTLIDDAKGYLQWMLNLTDSGTSYVIAEGAQLDSDAVSGMVTAIEEAGAYVSLEETRFTQNKDDIEIVLVCKFEKTNVEVSFVYEANTKYEYRDVYNEPDAVLPYAPTEITVQAVYPMSYYLKQAGSNTLMGMGTVFLVLIFISIIIGFFKYIPKALEKSEKKKIAKAQAEAKQEIKQETLAPAAAGGPMPVENPMDDSQLVAVITAAVYAAEAAGGNAVSKDTLIVRSISRARR